MNTNLPVSDSSDTSLRPCTNTDSCAPGTMHAFPKPGATVEFTCTDARIIGSLYSVAFLFGTRGVVTDDVIEEAHQVGVRLDTVVVWVDVDDDIKEIK